ncbi:MAG: hypothetical protein IH838_10070 [Proteobacteria bacterium]|nr:hypothetical protein [Pseudomonadota bacterium]
MNIKTFLSVITALLLSLNVAWAQDGTDGAEATIRLMGVAEADLPEAVTKEITLPDAVTEDTGAVDSAMFGLDTANENRERREEGLSQADDAWERGLEMAGEARDNLEALGRADDLPEPPVDPGPPSD